MLVDSPVGAEPLGGEIPPVEAPIVDKKATDELSGDFGAKQLDVSVKRIAAYGALIVAAALYAVGVVIIWKAMGSIDCVTTARVTSSGTQLTHCPMPIDKHEWHVFVGALVALFSVPTVLVITVLRSVNGGKKDPAADNVYAAIGEKLVSTIEKFAGKGKD